MAVSNDNGCGTWIAIAVVAVVVWQCTRDKTPEEAGTDFSSYSSVENIERERSDFDPSSNPNTYVIDDPVTRESYVSSGYQDAGAPYGCTSDCSGHDAGWEWAEENGITDPYDCGGNSLSFEEGCIAYAEEQQAEQPDDDRW